MSRPRRNLFALLGWLVWKLLALIGLPYARRKLDERGGRRRDGRRRRGATTRPEG